MPHTLPRGPIMADIAACTLSEDDIQRLLDPAVGGRPRERKRHD